MINAEKWGKVGKWKSGKWRKVVERAKSGGKWLKVDKSGNFMWLVGFM